MPDSFQGLFCCDIDPHLSDFGGGIDLCRVNKVGHLHVWMVPLHICDHLVTVVIELDASELNVLGVELTHKRRKLMAFWRPIWIVVTTSTVVPVFRSITDQEHLSLGSSCPVLVETLS